MLTQGGTTEAVHHEQRFKLATPDGSKTAAKMSVKDGTKEFRLASDDSATPTGEGGVYEAVMKLGGDVYLFWRVEVEPCAGEASRNRWRRGGAGGGVC